MEFIKKCSNIKANSILESVIALSIISICLYISILIYASVFSNRTTPTFYGTNNELDALFFLTQVQNDSLTNNNSSLFKVKTEILSTHLKQLKIDYKDNMKNSFNKSYYITTSEDE